MSEGSRFFEGKSAVQETLLKVTRRLNELGISYAVSGGLALFAHGYRRFTEDVDILVTAEGLQRVHEALDGLGYVRSFPGSKNLRDADSKVAVEFLVAGQFPGDGKPKPVAFPDPAGVSIVVDGIKYLSLPTLIELKLASGITEPTRLKDLSDVIELIKTLDLPEDFSAQLAPFVRGKFLELWRSIRQVPRRFILVWQKETLTPDMQSIEEIARKSPEWAELLEAMRADGVTLEAVRSGSAILMTTDPATARKYGMHDEREYWNGPNAADEGGDDSI